MSATERRGARDADRDAKRMAEAFHHRFEAVLVVNLLAALGLAGAWAARIAVDPAAERPAEEAAALALLEDEVAAHPSDVHGAVALARAYLDAGHPGHAAAVLRSVPADRRNPTLLYRLALAEEAMGRFDDALRTAALAAKRCDRARVDAPDAHVATNGCPAALLAAVESERSALDMMVRWGVQSPTDARRILAHRRAELRARVVLSVPEP